MPELERVYELRVTRRAMDDLGVSRDVAGGDLQTIRRQCAWPATVDKFIKQRTMDPGGTEAPMDRVGRQDIYALHGPEGQRSATWFDVQLGVVWLLGFTPEHNYKLLEDRAAVGELLPDADDDEVALLLERENLDFATRIGPEVRALVSQALAEPDVIQRAMVGGELLELDVSAQVVHVDGAGLAEVYLCIHLPLSEERHRVHDWPGGDLTDRVARAAGLEGTVSATTVVPDGRGELRDVDHARELVVSIRDVEL